MSLGVSAVVYASENFGMVMFLSGGCLLQSNPLQTIGVTMEIRYQISLSNVIRKMAFTGVISIINFSY